MKKVLFLLLAGALSLVAAKAAPKNALEDTSLVRISAPEDRAAFLNKLMREKLSLGEKEAAKVEDINARYEEQLQEITIANPANPFGGRGAKKSKEVSPFDKLSETRDKEMKKALSGKQYKEYDKQRWGFRNALKKQMLADKEERDRVAREEEARLKEEAAEKARAELAAAEKKSSKTAATKKSAPAKKAPAKKPAKKKK
jgi:hypothetical protein